MAQRILTSFASISVLWLLACSSSSSPAGGSDASADVHAGATDGGMVGVHASGFDQSCQKSADCVAVEDAEWSTTDPCCGHGCPSAAINVADQSKYSAALAQAVAQCMASGATGCGVDCIAVEAFCNAGKCDVCNGSGCADAGGVDAATD